MVGLVNAAGAALPSAATLKDFPRDFDVFATSDGFAPRVTTKDVLMVRPVAAIMQEPMQGGQLVVAQVVKRQLVKVVGGEKSPCRAVGCAWWVEGVPRLQNASQGKPEGFIGLFEVGSMLVDGKHYLRSGDLRLYHGEYDIIGLVVAIGKPRRVDEPIGESQLKAAYGPWRQQQRAKEEAGDTRTEDVA